ncbi:ABC transporter substrate-binding protein [Acidimangrovimonas sediminis]|uniref:ABC transporter substrate-binding protein n=1 Tax=Acidimangrovimonas sediminis TaxID=2056283 RepID=UPI000C7F7A5C|nr:ABC transporter substrate-binding protein [Acidimangrovimonas sediminis]
MTQPVLTRRGLLAATGATLALAGLPQRLMAATPSGVMVVAQIAEPKSLDPAADTAANDFRILVNLYDGLVRFKDGTLEVEPALAEKWDISEDGKEYTFHLRKGVKFHDGTDFDAEAVKFNFDRMLDDKSPYHDTGPFPLAFFFSSIDKTEAVDAQTVKFTLKEPYAPFLSNLATPTGEIVSPAAVKKYKKDYGRNPVGTGPYKFKEWKSNQRVVAERNDDYWDGKPGLKAVIFRPITDANTRTAEMLSGGVDLMTEVPPNALSQFKSDRYKMYEQVGPHVWFLILDCQKGPFKDKKVRQAANYAVNKEAICNNVLEGTASVANGPIAPAFSWAYDKDLDPYPYDPEKAKSLLKEAGVAEGTEITFYVTEGGSGMLDPVAMGTAIQADLAKVGLKAKIQTFEWNTFLGKVNPGLDKDQHADMAEMAWMTNDPDTLPYLTLRTAAWPEKGGFNSGYYSNPEVDKLLEEARTSTDQSKRADLYKKVAQIVHDDAPWVFVANWKQNAVSTDKVENFQLQPSFLLELAKVTKS